MATVQCSHSLDSEIARFFGFAPFTTTGTVPRTVLVPVQFLQCRVHADAFSAATGPFFSSLFPFPFFSLSPPPPPSRHLVRARLLLAGADLHFQDRLKTPLDGCRVDRCKIREVRAATCALIAWTWTWPRRCPTRHHVGMLPSSAYHVLSCLELKLILNGPRVQVMRALLLWPGRGY
ncbi:hypothetical protein M431DRAFT_509566 [Trichoderma harzianum CBS 226.95]|uniref:Uncharacterized protein n=1 Tax=Trichoderma harzianum CBS 226.95 TaxID=983964 RepID=A0A2T4A882_TRIHA|nr:hypothetical protein M431DRAFT_509566 [Trichoderma harzianum CBS 226.95]PTB53267.1 hypothetical protein M431DRAFT_509566 [Trichoderma harzianum CBS 226.95]